MFGLVTDIQSSMMGDMGRVQELARDLGADERTLRRAVSQGTLRARRLGPRRLRLEAGEGEYLRAHWQLLADLRRALRVERGVRLAVLYGSLARGDEDEDSDLDLLVSLAGDVTGLRSRLQDVTGRRVDVARLERVEVNAPLLLDRVLDEGRVLVDRDRQWTRLRGRHRAIRARARRSHRRQMAVASRVLAEITGD
jgi:predicted nucleotidyltransferase